MRRPLMARDLRPKVSFGVPTFCDDRIKVSRACPDKGDVLAIELPADKFIKNWTCYYRETSLKPIEWAEGR
jgi:hypothetical protein